MNTKNTYSKINVTALFEHSTDAQGNTTSSLISVSPVTDTPPVAQVRVDHDSSPNQRIVGPEHRSKRQAPEPHKYPLRDMRVGDSHFEEYAKEVSEHSSFKQFIARAQTNYAAFERLHPGTKFGMRSVPNIGVYIIRKS